MVSKIKCKIGDVFSIPVSENGYIFGKILFDVNQQYLKKGESVKPLMNYLSFFSGSFLVETYKGVFTSINEVDFDSIAVQSTFVLNGFLREFNGEIVANKRIDVETVSFPETLTSYNNKVALSVGELQLYIPMSKEQKQEIHIPPVTSYGYQNVILATLDYSGREDLIAEKKKGNYFEHIDLRSRPELRTEIYASINEDPNQSYYNMALKYGFDLKRFY